jgi:hypothetical protein
MNEIINLKSLKPGAPVKDEFGRYCKVEKILSVDCVLVQYPNGNIEERSRLYDTSMEEISRHIKTQEDYINSIKKLFDR